MPKALTSTSCVPATLRQTQPRHITDPTFTQRTKRCSSTSTSRPPVRLVAKYVFYHDISELQEQKRYFESLLEISPTAIVITDPESKITSWNPAAERLFGFTAEEAVGRATDDLVATRPELHEDALRYTEAASRGELVQALTQRTRSDGTLLDVELLIAPMTAGGEQVGNYVIYHDVTEVQQQKRWLESVLNLSPTAIITIDDEMNVTSWNPEAERLFGYSAEEAIGAGIDDLVAKTPEQREETARLDAEATGGRGVRVITRRTRKDGSLIDIELLTAPVLIRGERVGHVVIYHDVSEIQRQKRYYEALVQWSPNAIVLDGSARHRHVLEPRRRAAVRLCGRPSDRSGHRRSRRHRCFRSG